MLNISTNSVSKRINVDSYSALKQVEAKRTKRLLIRIIKWCVFLLFIVALMPWTQNIRTNGKLTTLHPEQRPQEIHSIISGRIEKWNVKEGDFVSKGDTIAVISEIKDQYFDRNLLKRTENQINLKKQSVDAYMQKIDAQNNQLDALTKSRELEGGQIKVQLQQVQLRIQNDSIDYQAAKLDYSIAQYQFERTDSLYKAGLKSLSDLEAKRIKVQQAQAKEISARNKWQSDRNELLNLHLKLNNIYAKFESDYAKILSDKYSTETSKFDTETTINKLENQYSNYTVRQGLYTITAPQDGYITQLHVQGIGETIKEGASLVSFMPQNYELAVEIYVDPIDLPLVNRGEHVRLQFDGWPAIVFSGWPGASYGTYGGEVYAIDQFIGINGKYRVLVKPDVHDHPWPTALRVGGGTKAMLLLNDVPIYYETWRKINGFPPSYYQQKKTKKK